MKRWMTPLATLAGIAAMVAGAQGQTTPIAAQGEGATTAGTQAKPTKQKPADKKTASTDQAKKSDASDSGDDEEPAPHYNSLELAYTTWKASRYANGMRQSGTVNGGFGIGRLHVLNPYTDGLLYDFDLRGTPGLDFAARMTAQVGSQTIVKADASQFSFFDPSVGTVNPSERSQYGASVDEQILPTWGAYAGYRFEQYENNIAPPGPQTDYVNKTFALGTQAQSGVHTLGANYSETRFSDLNETEPITVTDRGEVRYVGDWLPNLTVTGNVAVSLIQQRGRPQSWVRDYNFSGIYDVVEGQTVGAHVNQEVLDLTSVQNAYVKRKLDSGINYEGRLGQWGYAFGYQHREEERVRADHSYTDVPAWNEFNVDLTGRLLKLYRLAVTGSMENLTSAPIFQTDDPTLLYWSRKAEVQAKLSGGSATTAGYLSANYRYRENIDRQYALNWYDLSGGGSHIFSSNLLGYAEVALDQYSTYGSSPEATPLEAYFPSSETFSVGLDYTRNPREDYSLVMTSFYTQDQWGQQIALSYHLDLGQDRYFQFTYSPWLQRDRLYDVDTFTAPVLVVKVGVRF